MRFFPRPLRFRTALVLLVYWSLLHAAPAAAGLVPAQPTGATVISTARDADLIVVQRALENRIVAQKLTDYGVTPDQVKIRLASMSDGDLHTLAGASKGLPSGSDGLGVLISLLIVVLLVVLILKLMDKKIIVK